MEGGEGERTPTTHVRVDFVPSRSLSGDVFFVHFCVCVCVCEELSRFFPCVASPPSPPPPRSFELSKVRWGGRGGGLSSCLSGGFLSISGL
jgi:hypothetical protein